MEAQHDGRITEQKGNIYTFCSTMQLDIHFDSFSGLCN